MPIVADPLELLFLAPEILLLVAGLLLFLLGRRGRLSPGESALAAAVSLALAGLLGLRVQAALAELSSVPVAGGLLVLDGAVLSAKLLVLGIFLLIVPLGLRRRPIPARPAGCFAVLLLAAAVLLVLSGVSWPLDL